MKKFIVLLILLLPFTSFARTRHYKQPITPPPIVSSSPKIVGAFSADVRDLQVTFLAWNDLPVCSAPKTTFIYWENPNISLDQIINGSQDSVIRNFGNAVCPNTILSIFHEMNGDWSTWDGAHNSPQKIIQAYQHIHDIIGAKVKWAWVVNNFSEPSNIYTDYAQYYPGSSYVDIVGVDGFSWAGEPFSQVFPQGLFTQAKQFGKPVWLTSIGSVGNQNQFITDAINSDAQGIIYFNYDQFVLSPSALSLLKSL